VTKTHENAILTRKISKQAGVTFLSHIQLTT